MDQNVYILAVNRTAIGSFLGTLSDTTPVEIGTKLIEKMLDKHPVVRDKVEEVIIGNVLSAGHGQNVARQISINSGVSNQVSAYGVNMVCGSGLKAIYEAYTHIKAGEADCIIAGGVESMSQAKFVSSANLRKGKKMGSFEFVDTMLSDGLTDAFDGLHMGITAENLAKQYKISRQNQDEFAMNSQEKARKARDNGKFKEEIIPITVQVGRAEVEFEEDEYINDTTTMEKLSQLRTAFEKDGTVTAGNASGINDGAAFAFIVSEKFVKEHQLEPLAEILAFGQVGVDPTIMGIGPVTAIKKSLDKVDLSLEDMDVIELNEAFASQSLAVFEDLSKEYKMSKESLMSKINPNGGAIALGHPIGASGTRITASLIHELLREDYTYGLASLCIGGGMGISMVVKKYDKN
ncbi:acetyl-CoA C-acetyltransferase [Aerococcaceae bacterium WGS1372]